MKVSVLSHSINKKTPLYGGKRKVGLSRTRVMGKNGSSNVLGMTFNTHTSTHIDVPFHFIADAKTVTDYSPDSWIFNNVLIKELRVETGGSIDERDFLNLDYDRDTELLIIKTGLERIRGEKAYTGESPVVSSRLALFFKRRLPKLRAIGFDFISLSSLMDREEGRKAHRAFLGKGILIIEDMRLLGLDSRPDFVLVSPLFIDKADGAPVSVWAFYNNFNFDKYDYIFFDFDGVILDSVNIKTEAFAGLYRRHGRDVEEKVKRHHLANGGMDRYRKFKIYHRDFLGKEITALEMKALSARYSRAVVSKVLKAKYIYGVRDFLKMCKRLRKTSFVVSATPEREIRKIVKGKGLRSYFKEIKGSPASKEKNIQSLIRKYKVKKAKAVFFADSINDLEAANFNNIKFIGINYSKTAVNFRNFDEIMRKAVA